MLGKEFEINNARKKRGQEVEESQLGEQGKVHEPGERIDLAQGREEETGEEEGGARSEQGRNGGFSLVFKRKREGRE